MTSKKQLNRLVDIIFVVVLVSFISANSELIQELEHIDYLLYFISIVIILKSLIKYLNKKEISDKNNLFYIRFQSDYFPSVFYSFLFIVIALILGIDFKFDMTTTELIFTLVVGLGIIAEIFLSNLKKYFVVGADKSIILEDKDFIVDSYTCEVICSKFYISRTDENGLSDILTDIVFTREKAINFKDWIVEKQNRNDIKFIWKQNELIEEL